MQGPYPEIVNHPELKDMRTAAGTLEKLLNLLAIDVANSELLTWQLIKERYPYTGLGELALQAIQEQKRIIHESRQYEHIGLWEFHVGLIYLHWGEPQQALSFFATAQRYWTLNNNTAAAYLAQFAMGYMQQFDRLYAAAMTNFIHIHHKLNRLQRPLYSKVNKEFIAEMETAVEQAKTDLRRLSSQLSNIRPNNIEDLIMPSVPPQQHDRAADQNGRGINPIPGHQIIDEQLIWYRIHRHHTDNFLPEVEPDDWALVRKSTINTDILPHDLVVVDDQTVKSSIWLTNTKASEPTAKFRIFLGRMILPPQSFTRDSSGEIHLSHVQISEKQRASVDFEKIIGVVLGFWTSNVNL